MPANTQEGLFYVICQTLCLLRHGHPQKICGCNHRWIPVFNVLEDSCYVVVANPKYVRAIKGQETYDKASAWIADLFKFDIVPSSYIPCKESCALRKLFRYRQKLIGHRRSGKNHFQNALTVSNIALSSVLTNTFGKSATAIVDYILTGDVFNQEYCIPAYEKSDG